MDENPRIFLGYPLDLLLDRECKYAEYVDPAFPKNQSGETAKGGLLIPGHDGNGSGNIIIKGRPGTGKSTLAMQIAAWATLKCNNFITAYISLEESPSAIIKKAKNFRWENRFMELKHLHNMDENPSAKELGNTLCRILTQPDDCPFGDSHKAANSDEHKHEHKEVNNIKPKVLLPAFSPRILSPDTEDEHRLFWERYQQLRHLLSGAKWLRENNPDIPELRLFCIDNLNIFGSQPLNREALFRIFDLCKQFEVIGIFIMETEDYIKMDNYQSIHQDITEYMADTVISLQITEDKGYFLRYMEIEKSRYQHQIYGKHPFKLKTGGFCINESKGNAPTKIDNDFDKLQCHEQIQIFPQAIQLFPSLHYIVSASEPATEFSGIPQEEQDIPKGKNLFNLGVETLEKLLPIDMARGKVLTLEGPSGTFKTTLARNFLIQGLYYGENVLLINLHDRLTFKSQEALCIRLSETLCKLHKSTDLNNPARYKCTVNPTTGWAGSTPVKYVEYEFQGYKYPESGSNPKLYELAFTSGTLLPEEFVNVIRILFRNDENKIKRVVLDDVSLIGVSYPFLQSSKIAGDLFLTAFVHLMRNYGVDLVISGTTGEYKAADEIVNQSCLLADTVLSCRFMDVFGERMVLIKGEGLMAAASSTSEWELVPGVFRILTETATSPEPDPGKQRENMIPFTIDTEYLQGLVGFDSANIRRPGLSLTLEVSEAHTQYNARIRELLKLAFTSPVYSATCPATYAWEPGLLPVESSTPPSDINVLTFDSRISETMHDSLSLLGESPIDRTVVCAIDEFWRTSFGKKQPRSNLVDLSNDDEFEKKDYIVPLPGVEAKNNETGEEPILGWPYYSNVLLLVYREEVEEQLKIRNGRLPSWETLAEFTREFPARKKALNAKIQDTGLQIDHPFDFLRLSAETRSCLFIDTLLSGDSLSGKNPPVLPENTGLYEYDIETGKAALTSILTKLTEMNGIRDEKKYKKLKPLRELKAVQQIFVHHYKNPPGEARTAGQELNKNAAVYLCWFSQIRQLISDNSGLAERLKVCALPGRGIRGDWFLGIVKSSVSVNLGLRVIKKLCSPSEDYLRFAWGIGLPTRKNFYTVKNSAVSPKPHYFAWPRAREKVNNVFAIHRNAIRRSSIPYYEEFRQQLAIVFNQFIPPTRTEEDPVPRIKEIVQRLPEHFYHLSPGLKKDYGGPG